MIPISVRASFFALVIATSAMTQGSLPAQEKDRKTKSAVADEVTEKRRKERKKSRKSMTGALPKDITSAFPIGREFLDVSIPSYEKEVLKSVMKADSITRVDERFLDLINLIISVYNSEGEAETTIHMDEAAYDLTTQTLKSKTPAKIQQPQFTMSGNSLSFDTKTRFSRLEGDVKVVIPDVGKAFPFPGTSFGGEK